MGFYDSNSYSVERSVGFLVVSIAALLSEQLDLLLRDQLHLNLTQWRVLAAISEGRASTAAELCQVLNYDSGAMTRLIGKLDELGLLSRKDDSSDRRAYRLALTRTGRSTCQRGYTIARDNLNRALADLSHPQAEQLIALLQTVRATLRAEPPAGPARRKRR